MSALAGVEVLQHGPVALRESSGQPVCAPTHHQRTYRSRHMPLDAE